MNIDLIESRLFAATPGPWRMTDQGGIEPYGWDGPGEDYNSVAQTRNEGDWEFIAHSWEDILLLVAEVKRLRRMLGEG